MRITERSRISVMTTAQHRAAQRLSTAARVAASGQRVTKPSDDPAAYGSLVRRDYSIAMLEQHTQTASRAQGELEVAENALAAGVDVLRRAQETAVAGANATQDTTARKSLAEDVRTMREELLSIANTKFGNKYLFAGTRSDQIPFDQATGTFQGNDQIIRIPVMDGVTPPSNVSGAQTFTAAGGRDIFSDLATLAVALDNNDEAGIRAMLPNLTQGHAQLVQAQVQAGFNAGRFRDAQDVLTSTKSAIAERLNDEVVGDPATQITDLQLAKNAYERSVAVTKQLLSISSTNT